MSICNFRGDLISRISLIFRAFSFKFMRFLDNFCLFLKIFSFKIFAGIKFRGFRGDFCREIKSPRNLIPAKINPFKVLPATGRNETFQSMINFLRINTGRYFGQWCPPSPRDERSISKTKKKTGKKMRNTFFYKQPETGLSLKSCLNLSQFLRSKLLKIP